MHGIFDFSGFLEVISRLNTPDVFHKFGGQTCNITGFKGFSLFYLWLFRIFPNQLITSKPAKLQEFLCNISFHRRPAFCNISHLNFIVSTFFFDILSAWFSAGGLANVRSRGYDWIPSWKNSTPADYLKRRSLHKKWSFLLKISPVNVTKSAVSAYLVTVTGEILNEKLQFLCSDFSRSVITSTDLDIHENYTAENMKFSIKDFVSKMWPKPQEIADLVTFTEEMLNGKLHFLCSVSNISSSSAWMT